MYFVRVHSIFIGICLLLSSFFNTITAQTVPQQTTFACGIAPLSNEEKLILNFKAQQALQDKRNKLGKTNSITYVPIRPHIVRRSDGTGGIALSKLNQVMAMTNSYFLSAGSGIQFYFAGSLPNYINDDYVYNNNYDQIGTVSYDVYNALNQYYVPQMANYAGLAQYPGNDVVSTRSIVVFNYSDDYLGNFLIPHELGHNFNLHHTHQPGPTTELVTRGSGANCATESDLLCDTPADPLGLPGAIVGYTNTNPPCLFYDPNSTARDANGEAYHPSMTNIMSYYATSCSHDFTLGQAERMQAGLALRQSHTAYTLDYPSTNVTPVSNLAAIGTPTAVTLTWQDNASNEMGYFVERSISPTDGFAPIGGVGPNKITYTDAAVSQSTQYYYRVRPSNSTDNISQVVGAFSDYCRVSYATGCVNGDGLASVAINGVALSQNSGCSTSGYGQFTATTASVTAGEPVSFTLGFLNSSRPQGVTIWADLNGNALFDLGEDRYVSTAPATGPLSGTFVIPVGSVSGPMLLRILTVHDGIPYYPCGSYGEGETEDYTINVQLPPVSGLSTTNITATRAVLQWNSLGPGVTYDVEWRVQGANTWNSLVSSMNSWTLIGLSTNAAHEWRVRQTGTTTFAGPVSFTTITPSYSDYCRVTYTTGCSNNDGLSSVTINGVPLSQNSGCSVTGHSQFTTTGASVTIGQPIPFTLMFLDGSRPQGVTIWADLNQNYLFDLGEDRYVSSGLATGPLSGTIIIPQGMGSGPMLLRILTNHNGIPYYPCGTYNEGETEDYTINVQLPPVSGLTTTNITGTSAQLNWNSLGANVSYDVEWREQGSVYWASATITNTIFNLFNLNRNTAYEWRVRQTGTSTYSGPMSFTTLCSTPSYTQASPTRTTASLYWGWDAYWYPYPANTLRWRAIGAADWTTVTSLSTTYYSLTGLSSNTAYEWQVQTNCSASFSSGFTNPATFTTVSCLPPSFHNQPYVGSQTAQLGWSESYYEPGKTYELQYKVVGTPTWITLTSLTGTVYSLTGLSPNTQYEWRLRGICSSTESSSYTGSNLFTTVCSFPQYSSGYATNREAYLYWSLYYREPGTSFEVQYRLAGSADWTSITSVTATNMTLTGLAPSSTYEWRIRTLCPAGPTSDYTNINSFTTVCNPVSQYAPSIGAVSSFSAIVRWYPPSVDTSTRFAIRWRAVGTADWSTVGGLSTSLSTGSYPLTGLTNNTQYEWQIQTVCSLTESSTFTPGPSFTTTCPIPAVSGTSTRYTSSTFSWAATGLNLSYEVQHRAVGSPTWISSGDIAPNYYNQYTGPYNPPVLTAYYAVTGLTPATQYEWRIRTSCGSGAYSNFLPAITFSTPACDIPSRAVYYITDRTAEVSWYAYWGNQDTRYEIRWREVGTSTWTTISSLTTSGSGVGRYVLTNLTPNTSYEWQIRVVCSATESTTFSTSSSFQTTAPCAAMYTLRTGTWSDPGVWSCGRVPVNTDDVQVKHVVTIQAGYIASALRIRYDADAKLVYQANGQLKLGF